MTSSLSLITVSIFAETGVLSTVRSWQSSRTRHCLTPGVQWVSRASSPGLSLRRARGPICAWSSRAFGRIRSRPTRAPSTGGKNSSRIWSKRWRGQIELYRTLRPIRFGIYQKEVALNISRWIRQIHRWLSIAFTATVIANFVTRGFGEPPLWVTYSPLLPLFLLLFSGLYMFVLPYSADRKSTRLNS